MGSWHMETFVSHKKDLVACKRNGCERVFLTTQTNNKKKKPNRGEIKNHEKSSLFLFYSLFLFVSHQPASPCGNMPLEAYALDPGRLTSSCQNTTWDFLFCLLTVIGVKRFWYGWLRALHQGNLVEMEFLTKSKEKEIRLRMLST